jgi:hemerythrin
MKRDPHIAPLSRDHHHALLFAWKIRQGLKKSIDIERIRPYVLYFSEHHLEKHFVEEETLLFRNTGFPLCRQAAEEHRLIRQLIKAIRGNGADKRENYSLLADSLDRHIRFEEREVFPYLERHLTAAQLSQVGAELKRLHEEQPADDDYQDDFWN